MSSRQSSEHKIPNHVAIIMDGNGRWAKRRLLPRVMGHREGVKRVREVVRSAGEMGIAYLTLYTFSAENWNRPEAEVSELMSMLSRLLYDEIEEMDKNNVRFEVIGRISGLPEKVRKGIDEMRIRLSANTGLVLVLALNYGGRQEIVDMARKAAQAVSAGELEIDSIDIETLKSFQYMPDLPDPDLIIRTGAELRFSNYLLWQSAYAELYFTDTLWPDFSSDQLKEAIADYAGRDRRFGSVKE